MPSRSRRIWRLSVGLTASLLALTAPATAATDSIPLKFYYANGTDLTYYRPDGLTYYYSDVLNASHSSPYFSPAIKTWCIDISGKKGRLRRQDTQAYYGWTLVTLDIVEIDRIPRIDHCWLQLTDGRDDSVYRDFVDSPIFKIRAERRAATTLGLPPIKSVAMATISPVIAATTSGALTTVPTTTSTTISTIATTLVSSIASPKSLAAPRSSTSPTMPSMSLIPTDSNPPSTDASLGISPTDSSEAGNVDSAGPSIATGGVVGIAIGSAAASLGLAGLCALLWRRRRTDNPESYDERSPIVEPRLVALQGSGVWDSDGSIWQKQADGLPPREMGDPRDERRHELSF